MELKKINKQKKTNPQRKPKQYTQINLIKLELKF